MKQSFWGTDNGCLVMVFGGVAVVLVAVGLLAVAGGAEEDTIRGTGVIGLIAAVVVAVIVWSGKLRYLELCQEYGKEQEAAERMEFLKGQWTQRELLSELEPDMLEELVSALFNKMGKSARLIGGTRDGGVDVLVTERDGSQSVVQCKNWSKSVGVRVIRELIGTMGSSRVRKGYVIAKGGFSAEARKLADKWNIELIDGGRLTRLIEEHLPDRLPKT